MNSPLPQSISRAECGGCLLYSFGYLSLCEGDDIFAGNIFQRFAVSLVLTITTSQLIQTPP